MNATIESTYSRHAFYYRRQAVVTYFYMLSEAGATITGQGKREMLCFFCIFLHTIIVIHNNKKDFLMARISNLSFLPKEFLESGDHLSSSKNGQPALPCLVGVDGGGTKTVAVAYHIENQSVAKGSAGASNPESVGTAAAVDSCGGQY